MEKIENSTMLKKEELWRANFNMTTDQYLESRKRELSIQEKSKEFNSISKYFYDLSVRVKRIVNGNRNKSSMENDPDFFNLIVTAVRDYKVALLKIKAGELVPEMKGLCLQVSIPLTYWINYEIRNKYPMANLEAVTIHGTFSENKNDHWWVEIGSTIIDLTLEQFQNHPNINKALRDEIAKKITCDGVYISNDKNNIVYQNFYPDLCLYTPPVSEPDLKMQNFNDILKDDLDINM